jgi:PHD/YefM family antitoxin component YafN of YafNO toxin-antitoxin module
MTVGAAGIETISGALKRPKKQNGHSHGNYLVATHRVAATTNPNCQRVYSFDADRYERTTQPTTKELQVRARFAAVRAMVAERADDLSHISSDQAAFIAQKDTAGGKKTMRAYLWMVCGAEYDQEHQG